MNAIDERLRHLIAQQAADWFVANRAQLSVQQREQFAAWLQVSPVHVEEYLEIAAIAGDLREACVGRETSIEALIARARAAEDAPVRRAWPEATTTSRRGSLPPRRTLAAVTWAASGVLGVVAFAWWHFGHAPSVATPDAVTTIHFETAHGQQLTRRLPDQSLVHLNTDTAVTISYGASERIVMLTAGEVDFEVSHESKRPFRVFGGVAQVVDIGTEFDVRLEPDATVVTVAQGRVAVGRSSSRAALAPFVELVTDQQISVTQNGELGAPVAVDAHRTTSWLRRQIMFDHEPLARVATEFNRYSAKHIEIATPALRDLKISGVFATDDTAAFIAFLRSLEGVRVEVTATRIRVTRE